MEKYNWDYYRALSIYIKVAGGLELLRWIDLVTHLNRLFFRPCIEDRNIFRMIKMHQLFLCNRKTTYFAIYTFLFIFACVTVATDKSDLILFFPWSNYMYLAPSKIGCFIQIVSCCFCYYKSRCHQTLTDL